MWVSLYTYNFVWNIYPVDIVILIILMHFHGFVTSSLIVFRLKDIWMISLPEIVYTEVKLLSRIRWHANDKQWSVCTFYNVTLLGRYCHTHAKPPGFNYWPYKFLSWCEENMFQLVFFLVAILFTSPCYIIYLLFHWIRR